jgi:outer membrane protein insertion porin family
VIDIGDGTSGGNLVTNGWGTTQAGGTLPGDDGLPVIVAAPLHPGGRVNSLTLQYAWDTRFNIADPQKGSFRNVSVELAGGVLGGDNDFALYSLEQRQYFPMRGGRDVLAARVMLGTASGDVPLFESWSVGGSTTMRGYNQDRYRGENLVLGNLEYRYRLNETLGLVAFVDAGDAWGGEFRTIVPGFVIPADDQEINIHTSAGVGLRADTPLGPIRIDWASGEEGSEVHLGFGQVF